MRGLAWGMISKLQRRSHPMQLRLAAIGLVLSFSLHAGHALAAVPSKLVVFGDSNVDTGNLFGVFGVPGGRSSNGKLVTEYVAEAFGVPLQNFAWGGATSGATNVVGGGVANTGLLSQLNTFQSGLGGSPADAGALYIVWAGSNDLVGANFTNAADVQARIDGAITNLNTALSQLDTLGAKKVLVATRTPRPDLLGDNDKAGQKLNDAIRGLVPTADAALAAHIELFDAYALIADMVNNPAGYGFTQNLALCNSFVACRGSLDVARGWINWDDAHKTTRVHELMGQAMVAQVVPEPASVLMMGLGVLALMAVASRRRVARPAQGT
ncbi:MAG: PEP-CTERM sorting domain-containing protein [Burkholderiales bacterium]|nr:PEP-CTERM sorting domain-containing protein [Burkholderiales bacterium]